MHRPIKELTYRPSATAFVRAEVADGLTTVGLGPGFVVGGNVDVAVETARGERLGAVIDAGSTLPFAGEPLEICGIGRQRFVHAVAAGRFMTDRRIASRVLKGEIVGAVGAEVVVAPLEGVLRGLSARGARIAAGAKIVEVDPRGDPHFCYGPGERPLAVAQGVVAALTARGILKPAAQYRARKMNGNLTIAIPACVSPKSPNTASAIKTSTPARRAFAQYPQG